MKTILIIPTYNEKASLAELMARLDALALVTDYLFVDDNSPDGTAELISEWQKERGDIFLIKRAGKLGLGTAYIAGFKFALEAGYEAIVQMDADLSHDPVYLTDMLDVLSDKTVVVGSRYVSGGGVLNWSKRRQLLSRGGSWYARTILGLNIKDLTGGFNAWHREALLALDLDNIRSEGYSFQIEMKNQAVEKAVTIKEVPIIFKERFEGQSKMSNKIVLEAIYRVWLMFFRSKRGLVYGRFIKFCIVGLSGMLTDMLVTVFLVEIARFNVYLATCVSFCLAVTVTFNFNKYWTFKDRQADSKVNFVQFFAVSLGGLAWGLLLLRLLVGQFGLWYVYAKLICTVVIAFWNFIVNNLWTFRHKAVEN